MIEKDIKRLVVKRGESEVVGVLEQIDLISYFSNHTQIIISQIQKSNSFEELKDASESVTNIIKSLEAKGVKIRYIAKLLSQIHTKIFHKLYTMIFDEEFIKNSALIVMGSEGRSEQILRTDQDMGIIIRDDFDYSGYKDKFVEYTKYLIDFGFPECDGNIMTSNDFWSKNVDEYKKSIYNWIYQPSEQGFMEIAIFADARCVCGDEELLTDVKSYFFEIIKSNQKFLIAFANSALMFETPLNIFTNFVVDDKKRLDIKKGGIFAIVQGVRALALEHNIETTNTVERLKELNNSGILDREFTTELIESYELLLKLRLKHRLLAIDKGLEVNNGITPSDMSKLEQDLLKDSFRAVDKLKKLLTHHFRLNYV
jgi:CBS domain-containing protein